MGVQHPSLSPAVDMTDWRDSWTFHAGLELTLAGVDLRIGYVFDQTPVHDASLSPALPDANKRGLSGGIGYWVSDGLRLDFAYQYLKFDERPVVGALVMNSWRYRSTWTVLGVNVSYHWD